MSKKIFVFTIILVALIIIGFLIHSFAGSKKDNQNQSLPDTENGQVEGEKEDQGEINNINIKSLSTQKAKEIIQENQDNSDFQIIDVRSSEEFNLGHIKNAKNFDFEEDDFLEKINLLDQNKAYLIYCRTNIKSSLAVEILKSRGFKNLYQLREGYEGWVVEY